MLELAVLSELLVELVLDAGDERFCDVVDEAFVCFPCGEVLTDKGDVSPEDFVAFPWLTVVVWLLFKGGLLRVGAGPVVLRSWGDATPVDEVESAYLQLAVGFCWARRPGDCAPGEVW